VIGAEVNGLEVTFPVVWGFPDVIAPVEMEPVEMDPVVIPPVVLPPVVPTQVLVPFRIL
jgi:hypothetical protein